MPADQDSTPPNGSRPQPDLIVGQLDWRRALTLSDLKPTTRLVGHTLSVHMSAAGDSCFPSQNTIAAESGLSRSTVNSALRDLVDSGFLLMAHRRRTTDGRQSSNAYRAVIPASLVTVESGRSRGDVEVVWLNPRVRENDTDLRGTTTPSCATPGHQEEAIEEAIEREPPLTPPVEGEQLAGQASLLDSEPVARRSETKQRNAFVLAPHAEAAFQLFWSRYPRKGRGGPGSMDRARRQWAKEIRAGASAEELDRQLDNYRAARARWEEVAQEPCWLMAAPKWMREVRHEFDRPMPDDEIFQRWQTGRWDPNAGVAVSAGVPAVLKPHRDLLLEFFDAATAEARDAVVARARERMA